MSNRLSVTLITLLLGLVAWQAHAVSINTVTPSSGSLGTQVTINGFGFGTKPKVVMSESHHEPPAKLSLKVLSANDNQIVVEIKSGKATGDYDVEVLVKGQAPVIFAEAFTLLGPDLAELSDSEATPGDELTLSGTNFGPKPKVLIGGQKAKVIASSSDAAADGLSSAPETLTVLVPTKLANGFYDVTVIGKLGVSTLAGGLKIINSSVGVSTKLVFTCKVDGKTVSMKATTPTKVGSGSVVAGAYAPQTNITIITANNIPSSLSGSLEQILLSFAGVHLETDLPAVVAPNTAKDDGLISHTVTPVSNPLGGTIYLSEDSNSWQININSYLGGQTDGQFTGGIVGGTFSGVLKNANNPAQTQIISDGVFNVWVVTGGN